MTVALLAFCGAGIFSAALTALLIPVLRRLKFFDDPQTAARKVHMQPVVLGAGIAPAAAVAATFFFLSVYAPAAVPKISSHLVWGIAAAVVVLFVFGLADDKYTIPPHVQVVGPLIATGIVMASGVVLTHVTNPAGGVLSLAAVWWAPFIITAAWFLGMMYGTKLLDGLDGLVVGISAIGAAMVFFLTHSAQFYQPAIGVVALVFAGACVGFLCFNFYPARAFLGEGGALFLGFFLALLAIVSGSKIATTLLVMGVPVFDSVRVAVERVVRGGSPFRGDQLHLHHLLIRNGWSQRVAVVTYYVVAALFGVSALVFSSAGKVCMLVVLAVFVWGAALFFEHRLARGSARKRI